MLLCWMALTATVKGQNGPPSPYVADDGCPGPAAQAFPQDCGCGPADYPPACCPPTLDTDTTKDFGYYLHLPRTTLYAVAEGVALQRLPQQNLDFATLGGSGTGAVVLSTGDFNYDYQGGGRLLVGCTLGDCYQVEGTYMALAATQNTEAVRNTSTNALGGTGNLFSPFGNFGVTPITGVDYMDFAQIRYSSSLQEAELNIRRTVPMPEGRLAVSALFGVRYVYLPEEFDYDTISAAPSPAGSVNNFRVNTQNQMVGPQVGGLMEFYVDNRWWLTFEAKGAVMNDLAMQTTSYQNGAIAGPFTTVTHSAEESHTAFAEDIRAMLVYQWSPHFTTRLGYEAVFMQRLALAPDNLGTDLTLISSGPAQLNHTGNVIYQGPVAGISLAW
jgi:hypothetical protein